MYINKMMVSEIYQKDRNKNQYFSGHKKKLIKMLNTQKFN